MDSSSSSDVDYTASATSLADAGHIDNSTRRASGAATTKPANPQRAKLRKRGRKIALVVYACMLIGTLAGLIPMLIGLIMAYVKRSEFRKTAFYGHFQMIIGTFWYSSLYFLLGFILLVSHSAWPIPGILVVLLGGAIVLGASIWYWYRLIRGLLRAVDDKPVWLKY